MRFQKQKTKFNKSRATTNIKLSSGRLFNRNNHSILFIQSILAVGLALGISLALITSGSAQGRPAFIQRMRILEPDKTGLKAPAGLTFSSQTNRFYVFEAADNTQPAVTDIIKLTRFASYGGSARIAAQVKNPINMTFDNKFQRLLILKFPENQLLVVPEKADGNLDATALIRTNLKSLGLQDPQGLTVDPASGDLFILDAAVPQIVRLKPASDGSFDGSLIFKIKIRVSGLVAPRGLALDPGTGHLHLINPADQRLYELAQTGKQVAYRDLSEFRLGNPQGMVIAPSGDQTDDPARLSLYLADGNPASGQILEFSLAQPAPVTAEAISYTSSLIRTTDMSTISPPSPDPDGLAYLPLSSRLMVSDSEVDETVSGRTHFAGANVWELTLNGSVVRTANISPVAPTVVPMSDEPTGVAWSSANGHYFFSDDNAYAVWDLNPGGDGLVGTADDSWTGFDTLAVGASDPEGIAYDDWNNQLFVLDGTNVEIYRFSVTGTLLGQFDIAAFGVTDPEGVEFNSISGTLFVLSSSANRVIIETNLAGTLLQTIDVSASNSTAPAGLAYAPASDGSDAKRFYIVDRGIDNNDNPRIIDGKMYEMSAPDSTSTKKPTTTAITSDLPDPSTVGQAVTINYSVTVTPPESGTPSGNVTVSDGTNSCTGTVSAGNCSITFTTAGAKTLTATYLGDVNFSGSASTPATAHNVNPANTTTAITSDLPDPTMVGQAVTFNYSVTVTSPGSGTPTGNVTVSDGLQSCSGTVASGSCSITFTTAGAKTLTAAYIGNANFNGSASTPGTAHTVNKANTATTITSDSPDPSVVGQAVVINYSVVVNAPGSGAPTGNVTVSDGTDSCTGNIIAGSCSITFTSVGIKTLTATYAGDANYNTSISASASHAVRSATTTVITSDPPDPSVVGQAVVINYSVTVTPPGSGTPTGNVTVSDGTQSCTGTVSAGSCSISFTTAGAKSLTATYAGDTSFITSTSAIENHTVNAAATTTAITSDLPDPSVTGQVVAINYSVAVTSPGSGTPTGTVTVSDGIQSCSGTVASGSCSLAFSTAGARNLTATYNGNLNFSGSASTPVTAHTVNKASTTTTITSDSPDPSVVGQAVTFNYSLVVNAPGSGTPTGNVTISDGTDSCTGTVAAGSCSITFTSVGVRTLSAAYTGSTNFGTSGSTTVSHIVNAADTTTVITSDQPDPSVVGQMVTINYTVTVDTPGGGSPTGNVTVSDGSQSCTGTVAAGSCSITFTTAGAKSLSATYIGNENFSSSISTPTTAHTVNKASTSITITSDLPDPSMVNQSVTINYNVTVPAPGSGTPTGSVTVSDGTQSCIGTVAAGNCSIIFVTTGVKTLIATYAGDANFKDTASTPASTHTVNNAPTTTTISSHQPDPSMIGQLVTINYSVTVTAPGSGTPTGNVTISDGTQSCTGSVAAGSCSIGFTTPGTKTLTATYMGDGIFSGSTSPAIQHTVIIRVYLPLLRR